MMLPWVTFSWAPLYQVIRRSLSAASVLLLLGFCGCASSPNEVSVYEPPQRQWDKLAEQEDQVPLAVYDPIETTNRRLYKFNAQFDDYVFLPIVRGYEEITPVFVQDRVSSFFRNLGEISTFMNSVLQVKPEKAGNTLVRFVINSTVGILGFFDPATEFGISRESEDFGQTLGYWGAGEGSYIVLPVLGPSNLRDSVGIVVDALTFSFVVPNSISGEPAYDVVQYGVRPIDARHLVKFRYHQSGSPFEYELVRYLYTTARAARIEQ